VVPFQVPLSSNFLPNLLTFLFESIFMRSAHSTVIETAILIHVNIIFKMSVDGNGIVKDIKDAIRLQLIQQYLVLRYQPS
ncbi:MAG: hypothetical protein QXP38_08340, partial [Nitrososphaerota archaeon]